MKLGYKLKTFYDQAHYIVPKPGVDIAFMQSEKNNQSVHPMVIILKKIESNGQTVVKKCPRVAESFVFSIKLISTKLYTWFPPVYLRKIIDFKKKGQQTARSHMKLSKGDSEKFM